MIMRLVRFQRGHQARKATFAARLGEVGRKEARRSFIEDGETVAAGLVAEGASVNQDFPCSGWADDGQVVAVTYPLAESRRCLKERSDRDHATYESRCSRWWPSDGAWRRSIDA